jgi:putative sugar O-methyltransferase
MGKSQFGKELFKEIINDMEDQIQLFEESSLGVLTIGESWYKKIVLIREKLKDLKNLTKFRYNNLVVLDEPSGDLRTYKLFSHIPFLLKYTVMGKLLEDRYAWIKKYDLKGLLVENPVGDIGAPVCYKKNNLQFTNRWIRQIYLFSLLKRSLGPFIGNEIKIIMDIGSSYGGLASIIKKNYPKTNMVLVDLPEQLAAAQYYLRLKFPKAKFAKYNDLKHCEKIDRDLISNYDFLLIPSFMFEKLEENSVDLITNVASLNEMTREWVDYYVNSRVFCTTKYICLVNRILKEQNIGTKISILDMHLERYDCIHFDLCPYFDWLYKKKLIFKIFPKTEKIPHPPFYEFIGKKRINNN